MLQLGDNIIDAPEEGAFDVAQAHTLQYRLCELPEAVKVVAAQC